MKATVERTLDAAMAAEAAQDWSAVEGHADRAIGLLAGREDAEGLRLRVRARDLRLRAMEARKRSLEAPADAGVQKKCKACGQSKPLAGFGSMKKNRDGLDGSCKGCRSAQARMRRRARMEEGKTDTMDGMDGTREMAGVGERSVVKPGVGGGIGWRHAVVWAAAAATAMVPAVLRLAWRKAAAWRRCWR